MATLPSIMDAVGVFDPAVARFVKPKPGDGYLEVMHAEHEPHSPAAERLSIRRLTLPGNTAIPVHVHHGKEKLYVRESGECLVLVFEETRTKLFRLDATCDTLVIPAGKRHALVADVIGGCGFLIVASNQDASDIFWEERADELVMNRHLVPDPAPL